MEKENKVIYVCQGLQGSGKTTWAKQWAEEDSENRIRINRDDIRNMLGKYWVPQREDFVTNIEDHCLIEAMKNGYDIVLDSMHLSSYQYNSLDYLISYINTTLRNYSYRIVCKPFPTPVSECIRRDSERENPIGKDIIINTYKKNEEFIHGIFGNDYIYEESVQDKTLESSKEDTKEC